MKSRINSPRDILLTVAPFTGAWIEISTHAGDLSYRAVAPFTGAWIEISAGGSVLVSSLVAPFTGAWIEITLTMAIMRAFSSLPSRERGLKLPVLAPLPRAEGRSLHGSVD